MPLHLVVGVVLEVNSPRAVEEREQRHVVEIEDLLARESGVHRATLYQRTRASIEGCASESVAS